MNWNELRRIVTEDRGGRSRIMIDGEPARTIGAESAGLAEIWEAGLAARQLLAGADRLKDEDLRLEPRPDAVKVRWFTVPPEKADADPEAKEAQAEAAFAAVGAAHVRVDVARHPMMHKTDTLDAIIMIKGEVDLLLDDGEAKSLKPGDVVIQRATNHAWVNRGQETALLVAVLMGGTRNP